jgi:hypothetical protein
MIMVNKRIMLALFAIAIASSFIVVTNGSVDSAYAAKKVKQDGQDINLAVLDKDESRYRTSRSANAGDSGWTIGDSSGISAKEVNMWKKEFNA